MTAKENDFNGSGSPVGGVLSDPPVVEGKIDDHRVLKSELQKANLQVKLDGLSNAASGEATLYLNHPKADGSPGGRRELIQTKPLDGAATPILFELPTAKIPELATPEDPTEYTVYFEVFDSDGNDDHSTDLTRLRVDLTPPWQTKVPFERKRPPKVTYVNAPVGGKLDRKWFTDNPGGLQCIADVTYPFRDPLDIFRFYLSSRSVATSTLTPVYEGTVSATGAFTVPVDKLKELGNTTLYQINTVEDRVPNRSVDSIPVRDLEVSLPPAPTLFAPTVPATGTDGSLPITLVTYNPLGTQVFVEIRRPTDGEIADRLTVSLGALELGTVDIVDATTTPLRIELTYDLCKAVFGTATEEIGAVLSYTLTRGADTPIPSPTTRVFLNLRYPGPDLIPEPDLESMNLPPVEVRGYTETLNHIVPADFNQPVVFRFNKWELDLGADLFEPATVSFYYNDKFMGDAVINPHSDPSTVPNPTPIEGEDFCVLRVAFQTIANEGVGDKTSDCTLAYPGNSNIVQQKDKTPVRFEAVEVKLQEHVARTYNSDKAVSCPSLDMVAGNRIWKVTAPAGQPALTAGLAVTLNAQGYEDKEKTRPIGSLFTQINNVATTGAAVDFEVPFAFLKGLQGPIVAPPGTPIFHYMEVWYGITISGAPFKSPEVLHRINVRNTSSLYCDGTA